MKRLLSISILLVCCLGSFGRSAGQQPSVTGNIFAMEWSPDSSAIAIVSSEGAWLYWNGDFHQITSGEVYDVTWSHDGTFIALLHWIPVSGEQIEIWNVSLPAMPVRIRSFTHDNLRGDVVENLDWSPTNNLIAVSGIGIRIWNADTGNLVRTLQPNEPSGNVRWSPDGNSIASFYDTLAVWDSTSGALQHEIDLSLFIGSGSWGNDSQHIAVVQPSTSFPSKIYVLDLTQADFSPTILSYNGMLTVTEWKENTLVSYTSPGLAVWDILSHQVILSAPSDSSEFALSPDGSQIAYIQDGVLQIQTVNTPFVAPTPTPIAD